MAFRKSTEETKTNFNLIKKENISELIEIPKSEYVNYKGRETIYIGGGMITGEYKFGGQRIIITEGKIPQGKFMMNEEEILKEINKRKSKSKKEKKKRYEILDRFYGIIEFDGKPIKKFEKAKKNFKYQQQQKYYINPEEKEYQYNSKKTKGLKSFIFKNNQKRMLSNNMKINNNNLRLKNFMSSTPSDNYSKYIFEQINQLREDPQSYIGIIEDAKNNIIKDKGGRLLYNSKQKIALKEGEPAFNKAINYLKNLKPMKRLEFNPYITVKLPKSKNELKNKNYLKLKVEKIISDYNININSYWIDIIKDPKISFLMMIVDDNGKKCGMKRKDLLDPNMKYIGISSIDNNGSFVCYITLSSDY